MRCLAIGLVMVLSVDLSGVRAGTVSAAEAVRASEHAVLADLAGRATRELQTNILPFWIERVSHPDRGGFYGEVRADGSPDPRAPRGALMTCRILWTFSAALRRDPRVEYRAMADRAFADLEETFWDREYGGLFWTATPKGAPLARHKQVYLQAFGIYALSEYHRATGNEVALDHAKTIFRRLEHHTRDVRHGGYLEAFSRDWSRELPKMRRLIGGTAPKSQNTHLHVMEAYANLLRVWPDPALHKAEAGLVDLMLERILDPATHHLGLYFETDWTRASEEISYGHDIEFVWLVCDAADALGDSERITRSRDVAVRIARATLAEGVSPLGGIYNEGSPRGITNANHEWWSQAEAVIGFIQAYQISGDVTFLDAARSSWSFIEDHVIDRAGGEWFLMLGPDGRPLAGRPKAGLWKCPYHNGRASLEIAARAATMMPGARNEQDNP